MIEWDRMKFPKSKLEPEDPRRGSEEEFSHHANHPDGHIDDVLRVLNSREGPDMRDERTPLSHEDTVARENWEEDTPQVKTMKKRRIRERSVVKTFLGAAVLFFVVALGFSAYVFYREANVISAENVNLLVGAPLTVVGGEEVPIEITIENKNAADIQSATLLIQFPEGTRSAENRDIELQRFRDTIGDVLSGESSSRTVRAVFFGGEREVKKVNIEVDYRMRGSNAVFSKKKEIEIELSAAPIAITVDSLDEVSSNQLFEISATLSSNSQSVTSDVLMKVEYPFGFSFVSSDPPAFGSGNDVWQVGDIIPGDRRTIRIRGTLSGQDADARAFRFTVGTKANNDPKKIDTLFVSHVEEVAIKSPFIGLAINFDGAVPGEDYAFPGGRPVTVNIDWVNNLETRVADAVIEVKVRGSVLDRPSIRVRNGHYRSIDDTIVFDRATDGDFALLNPGDRGTSAFTFSFIPPEKAADSFLQNQEITFEASVRGRRMSGDTAIETLQNAVTKKVKVSSDMSLSTRTTYSGGPIVNWGPMPPRAEQQTRYTVTWTVTNSFNAISNAQVVAPTLPTYVRWTGVTYPPSEDIKLLDNGAIVWNVGEVKPYAGYASPAREVQFQVEILPSITQIGTSPTLVHPSELTATDRFTGVRLFTTGSGANTNIFSDPLYQTGFELVAQ